ncbi:hypothetical protein BAU15_14585 [Enterococcus sp. JM4C]|uniref:FtsX-like permease family protein n=1 Tax=Candidatus Enterococcus huntleyi TaxID=1857217 RepID=UPI00137B7FE1|nr:FtsX-like permease family protein [Enterococcus sp. JM4C]KAF1296566.1 hypothetical protein BAU15_14585 [Enterococcus sp. JM4C]
MIQLVWLQFKHSWKIWVSSLFIFIVAGFLSGICLTGLFSLIQENNQVLLGKNDPTPIFLMPTVFGGLTLFFVIGGVIRLVINYFQEEYILWTILGSNPTQLSLLIGGQLAIVGAIGGFIGYLIAVPFTSYLYYWMQTIVGQTMLPSIQINFSFSAFLVTILFCFLLGGLGGFKHARKVFIRSQKDIFSFKKPSKRKFTLFLLLMIFLCLGILCTCYYQIFISLSKNKSTSFNSLGFQLCFIIIFTLLILLNLTGSVILPAVVKIWTRLLPREKSATVNTAYWEVLAKKDYLTSLLNPMIAGAVLLSGFSSIMVNILSQVASRTVQEQNIENLLIFILYVGAPLLIILVNVLVITLVSGKQQLATVNQLIILGFSSWEVLKVKIMEVLIYSLTFLLCSLSCNVLISIAVIKVAQISNGNASGSWGVTFYWSLSICLGMFIVLSSIHIFQLKKYMQHVV